MCLEMSSWCITEYSVEGPTALPLGSSFQQHVAAFDLTGRYMITIMITCSNVVNFLLPIDLRNGYTLTKQG